MNKNTEDCPFKNCPFYDEIAEGNCGGESCGGSAQEFCEWYKAYIGSLESFRMDELEAVMTSVDKWLKGEDLKNNPATRAADAREVALKAIEAETARADRAEKALKEALAALEWYADEMNYFPRSIVLECQDKGVRLAPIYSEFGKRARVALGILPEQDELRAAITGE